MLRARLDLVISISKSIAYLPPLSDAVLCTCVSFATNSKSFPVFVDQVVLVPAKWTFFTRYKSEPQTRYQLYAMFSNN